MDEFTGKLSTVGHIKTKKSMHEVDSSATEHGLKHKT